MKWKNWPKLKLYDQLHQLSSLKWYLVSLRPIWYLINAKIRYLIFHVTLTHLPLAINEEKLRSQFFYLLRTRKIKVTWNIILIDLIDETDQINSIFCLYFCNFETNIKLTEFYMQFKIIHIEWAWIWIVFLFVWCCCLLISIWSSSIFLTYYCPPITCFWLKFYLNL